MARVPLTPQQVTTAGLNPTLTTPTPDGDVFSAGRVALWVANGDDEPIVVTAITPSTTGGQAIADAGGTVPAGQMRLFGPFPRYLYGQPFGATDEGRVYVNYSAINSVTRGLIKL